MLNGLTVGSRTTVGAGACVIKDAPSDSVMVRVPAVPLVPPSSDRGDILRVIVATEARLFRDRAGRLRAPTQGRAYGFWTRYLEEFSEVRVLTQVASAQATAGTLSKAQG